MKSCPACNRTFEDTLTFCLVDGSILSAPFDPGATRPTASRDTDPARTERIYAAPNATGQTQPSKPDDELTPLAQTIASQTPVLSPLEETFSPLAPEYSAPEKITSPSALKTIRVPPPEVAISNSRGTPLVAGATQASQSLQSHSGGRLLPLIIGVGLLLVIAIGGIGWFVFTKTRGKSSSSTQPQQAKVTEIKPKLTGQSFTENINGVPIQMVSVSGGTFLMGSPLSETGRDKDEGPQNSTTVQSFDMSKYEVTQAQYKAVMGTNPSTFKGDDRPVDSVSWNDAVEFCRKLSQITGREYRLPTEAEWEYACRAGTSGPYAAKVDAMTWYGTNSGSQTHPVGQKQPNGFGLYDMYGNVWEWCQSKYKPYPYNATDGREALQETDVRVMRGGSWQSSASSCRSAYRRRVMSDLSSVGFRVVLTAR